MRFLFVHQNFPGQYCHLAALLAKQGHQVVAIGEAGNMRRQAIPPGIRTLGYKLPPVGPEAVRLTSGLQSAVHRGRVVADGAIKLREAGFRPDVLFAHLGWGEAIFLKDVFPKASLMLYCEFFYRASGSDVGFDPEYPPRREQGISTRLKNAPLLMALDACDRGVAATAWQRNQFPSQYLPCIDVIHDGIDTQLVAPEPRAVFRVPGSDVALTAGDKVVTYVARNLEPYRGFHVFMRAIPEIQRLAPDARIVIVGGDDVSYSPRLPIGHTYRERMMEEMGSRIDYGRVHFTGRIPYPEYLSLLRASTAHVYLTYPFVLSWSMLEAMAAGCVVIGSRTAPVEEVIQHGKNGLLVDFFSPAEIAEQVASVLARPERQGQMRHCARSTVLQRFDLKSVCLPRQLEAITALTPQRLAA